MTQQGLKRSKQPSNETASCTTFCSWFTRGEVWERMY